MNRYSRVFRYLKHYKGPIGLYFLFIILSIVFSIVSIGMLMPFIDLLFNVNSGIPASSGNPVLRFIRNLLIGTIESQGKLSTLGLICVIIVITIFLKNLFLYLSYYVLSPMKHEIINRLRIELFDKVLHLPIGFFTEKRKGDLISRMTNDVNEIEVSIVSTLEGWIREPLSILFNLGFLFYLSPQLTLFLLVFIPVIGFIIGRISKILKRKSFEVALKHSESLSVLDETLGGLRVIKAFNIEHIIRKKFFSINAQLVTAKNKIQYRKDLSSPMSEFLGVVVFASILWYGGSRILSGSIPLEGAAFIGYLALYYNIITPVKSLSLAFTNIQKGTAAMMRIEELMTTPVTVDDNPGGVIIKDFNDKIEFRNVGFSYENALILENINLKIEKGKTIALVGSSGAGKSTLADLVPRFHDVTSGELLIDGINIRDYSLHSLRKLMSIVTQEPILFNDTIAANIALGYPDATKQEIEQAAKIANAHDFITRKENGYQTNIGDRGSKLSGGEKQRLTIARAVLKNPPMLILDEATSSLDTESEKLVQDAINNMTQNRTSIVIAHRLSTIRHADEIIVLQKGKIVERGTHDQLLSQDSYYRKLVEMQEVK